MVKIKNERGSVLVTTILLMAILLSLGIILSNISMSEYRQVERDKKEIQAYYLARSGAES